MSLSVHNNPPLGLVFMLLCEAVCTQYPSPGNGVHVALCLSTQYPSPGLVSILLCVCLYTIPLPWVWCSCCSVSVYTLPLPCESVCAQYGTPPMGLVLMLLCESVCTNYPSPGFGVHVALRVSLYTLPLPWVWCSCCSASLSVHNTPSLCLMLMLLCESVCIQCPSPGFGVHVALRVCLYTIPLPCVWCSCCPVNLYTLPLPWVWCSCCPVSLSVHTTPPLGLVFMLLCESVCTQ